MLMNITAPSVSVTLWLIWETRGSLSLYWTTTMWLLCGWGLQSISKCLRTLHITAGLSCYTAYVEHASPFSVYSLVTAQHNKIPLKWSLPNADLILVETNSSQQSSLCVKIHSKVNLIYAMIWQCSALWVNEICCLFSKVTVFVYRIMSCVQNPCCLYTI